MLIKAFVKKISIIVEDMPTSLDMNVEGHRSIGIIESVCFACFNETRKLVKIGKSCRYSYKPQA